MSSPPVPVRGIVLSKQWTGLRGAAHGIGQSTMTGQLLVAADPGRQDRFDAVMAQLLDEPAPVLDAALPPPQAAVQRLLQWYGLVQRSQRVPVFGDGRVFASTAVDGGLCFHVALPFHTPAAASRTLAWLAHAMAATEGEGEASGDAAGLQHGFSQLLLDLRKQALEGTNNFYLVQAGHALGIPTSPMLPGMFRFGQGARLRWLHSTMTDRTSGLAVQIAHSKRTSAQVLRMHGLPVPRHEVAADAEAAVQAARRIGFPVVIKPDDQEQGRGVAAGLEDEAAVRQAFAEARALSAVVLVEKHHSGADYRINVLDGKVIKILHRRPGAVDGDGIHTVDQLVEIDLAGPRLRRAVRQTGRRVLDIDDEALSLLAEQGLRRDQVPEAGRRVLLRRKCNISAGGIQTLVQPEDAHPDNLALAIDATRAVGLDLCGVDMLLPDIRQSWRETGGVVIEVNAKPQIGYSTAPEVYELIVRRLVEGDGRVPVHLALVSSGGAAPPEQLLAMARSLGCNGVASAQGAWIDGRMRGQPVRDGFEAAGRLLVDRELTGLLCALDAAEIIANGLPVDRVDAIHRLGEPADARQRALLAQALAMAGPLCRQAGAR
ncbi:hypothetical protein GCM10027034_24530 [Ramlibacter solisilvae]|uniref:acetate--CoA ligase family protein n=1 Tax=Ramlibacter tataouinensis TaxID=94132 RepID=UPI000778033C|nr:acetate--CoA ligase family protein [Ramlibacter tataouinensis]